MRTFEILKNKRKHDAENDLKIVIRSSDGSLRKGLCAGFSRDAMLITFIPKDKPESAEEIDLQIETIKAVFFVKDYEGNKEWVEPPGFHEEWHFGMKAVVRFEDGEEIFGYVHGDVSVEEGFFMYPGNAGSNNKKIFIPAASASTLMLVN